MRDRVLVLDCWTRKALSVVRSLGRAGVIVEAAAHKRATPAMLSKFVSARHHIPPTLPDAQRFRAAVFDLLKSAKFDALFVLEDDSIEALLPVRAAVEELTSLPLPPAEAYEVASDKCRTLELAKTLNVPVPRSICATSISSVRSMPLEFPMVLKPAVSGGSRGMIVVHDAKELELRFESIRAKYGTVVVQDAIPWRGQGLGVACLFDTGIPKVVFSYKRLREFPVRGGPSTLRESTDDPELKQIACRLLESLHWHGVAMVEFKTDPRDGVPKLMEINPRFWGSLELANAAGVNFPALLLDVAKGREARQPAYTVGTRCRWLVPGDIAHFIANPERLSLQPSFFSFFDSRLHYDDFARDDIKGSLAVLYSSFLDVFDRETWVKGVLRR